MLTHETPESMTRHFVHRTLRMSQVTSLLGILGAMSTIVFATPSFAIALVPLSLIYVSVMNYFRAVSRELKRIESLTRSPIYTHFSESLNGLSTIQAFGDMALNSSQRVLDERLDKVLHGALLPTFLGTAALRHTAFSGVCLLLFRVVPRTASPSSRRRWQIGGCLCV